MNPQYMQQQHPSYGPPPQSELYGELNANIPPKEQHDQHILPSQKPPLLPISNAPPISNTPSLSNVLPTRSPYYVNDVHGQAVNSPQGLHSQPSNQNNFIDQMSNMTLCGPPRSPSSQGTQERSLTTMPSPSTMNGMNNQNHYPTPGDCGSNISSIDKPGPPTSHMSSLPSSYRPPSGPYYCEQQQPQQQQHGSMPPNNFSSVQNKPRSTPQPISSVSIDQHNQAIQHKSNAPPISQADLSGLSLPGRSSGISFPSPINSSQHSFVPASLPVQSQVASYNQMPPGPASTINQQNISGPPLPISYSTAPSMPNRQSLSGPPLPGPNFQSQSVAHPHNLSRTPLPGHTNNLTSPPLPNQQSMPSSYGQQNVSTQPPLSQQQSLHSQYQYGNQITDHRRFSPSPSVPGQQNAINSYGHANHQYSETSYQQGFQQNYGQNVYGNQPSLYQGNISPTSGYQAAAQSQQSRRLDPDQMPSPIQVINDDQKTKGGVFTTNQKGLVPPLVTTKFTVEDQGNASPRFIRSSMYTVPTTADIIKQTQVPFSLILSPMAQVEEGEYEPHIVDMGEIGPIRCNRCKAYMSPYMQFIDAGRRFMCLFCKATTEVPTEYFQHLDHTGQRMDRYERPELMLGTYEFIATKDYCRNNVFPKPPAVIFVIDISYNTMKSGLVNLLCNQMKKIIRNLPVDVGHTKPNMKVGFITYGSAVQFYNLKANLAQPQMMIVGDVHDVFMPLLDGFLVDPEESEALIDSLMSQIPTMFGDTRETEIILAPAIQAGLEALKASDCTGKLMVFHSSLPIADAPGKLKNRDDRKLIGTDKEKSILAPQTNFYNNLGQDCVGAGCSVDLFIFNNSYIDIATIGQVARLTGGEVYKYTYFQADIDGERLITDIINNISRPVAFDAVMRVRTSTGVRPTDFFGHFYMSNTTDVELASIDCDKAIAVEVKHDDKLGEDDSVYIQAALLYTSCSGVRRLRIMNLSLKTSSQMAELYRACDLDAMINYLFKQSVYKLIDSSSKAIKDNLNAKCATILASYRKHCASPSSAGQLILPECMKLLPLYINGIQKSDAITGGGGITVDQKSFVMMAVATMPIIETIVHVYPRLLPLHDIDAQDTDLPPMLRCSIDKFMDDGAYLLENGIHMFMWLGSNLSSQWVQSTFGTASVGQVDTDKTSIPVLDNALNKRIRDIIAIVQSERRYCMRLTLTRQRDKMEIVMRQFLVEDRGADGGPGYVDFLCHMHREIRTLLS